MPFGQNKTGGETTRTRPIGRGFVIMRLCRNSRLRSNQIMAKPNHASEACKSCAKRLLPYRQKPAQFSTKTACFFADNAYGKTASLSGSGFESCLYLLLENKQILVCYKEKIILNAVCLPIPCCFTVVLFFDD